MVYRKDLVGTDHKGILICLNIDTGLTAVGSENGLEFISDCTKLFYFSSLAPYTACSGHSFLFSKCNRRSSAPAHVTADMTRALQVHQPLIILLLYYLHHQPGTFVGKRIWESHTSLWQSGNLHLINLLLTLSSL